MKLLKCTITCTPKAVFFCLEGLASSQLSPQGKVQTFYSGDDFMVAMAPTPVNLGADYIMLSYVTDQSFLTAQRRFDTNDERDAYVAKLKRALEEWSLMGGFCMPGSASGFLPASSNPSYFEV